MFGDESLKEVEERARGGYIEECTEEFEVKEIADIVLCKKHKKIILPFGAIYFGEDCQRVEIFDEAKKEYSEFFDIVQNKDQKPKKRGRPRKCV